VIVLLLAASGGFERVLLVLRTLNLAVVDVWG
jgi:hypothetical protein